MHWVVAQIGSRELYLAARSFHLKHRLRLLLTDSWCGSASSVLRRFPKPVCSFSQRYDAGIPSRKVVAWTGEHLARTGMSRLTGAHRSIDQIYHEFLTTGKWFGSKVARYLHREKLSSVRDGVFIYSTGALETLELMRERNVLTVLDQIDLARVDEEEILKEHAAWPGWERHPGRIPEPYFERLQQEWHAASVVLVNSEWSKSALIRQGVADSKIIVVPLAYETECPVTRSEAKRNRHRPLKVLWLGQVILRKGIPYLFQAASALAHTGMQFIVAGPVGISDEALATAPSNLSFVGQASRVQSAQLYNDADVFVLPTVSDGFAITQIEAMAHGLPVVATPNCGSVVQDGVNGFIIRARDSQALSKALLALDQDRGLLAEMSRQALIRSRDFSLERFAENVELGLERLGAASPGSAETPEVQACVS